MTELRMSGHDVEDVLAGRQPDGRADLAPLADVTAVLHASREAEPPPMSERLQAQVDGGVAAVTGRRDTGRRHRRASHLTAASGTLRGLSAYRRPLLSLVAASAVLVGLVAAITANLPGPVHSAVVDVGSAIGLDVSRGGGAGRSDPAGSVPSTTTTSPPPGPQESATAPSSPAPSPERSGTAADGQEPWWLSPEFWDEHGLDGWGTRDGRWQEDGGAGDAWAGDAWGGDGSGVPGWGDTPDGGGVDAWGSSLPDWPVPTGR